jgi:hypothetical protein
MPTTNIVVGPTSLANFLARDMPDVGSMDIEADIRENPAIYYSDYVACCEVLKTRYLSEGAWVDLCRS